MPVSYQIVPSGSVFRPKVETHINDNSFVESTTAYGGGTVTSALCVFTSPKGRDNEVITISNGYSEFVSEFGIGAFSQYGQPLMNAYAAALSATTSSARVHCMRVMPDDAAYSTATLIAKYKADTDNGTMDIRYVIKASDSDVTALTDLDTACTVDGTADEDGYTSVKLFTIAYLGRGAYGKNLRFRITGDSTNDKLNSFRNYFLAIYRYEDTLEQVENFCVSAYPDAVYNSNSLYFEDVVNDADSGSDYVTLVSFPDAFTTLYDAYLTVQPNTTFTMEDFDPFLGVDKYTKGAIEGLTISAAAIFADDGLAAGEIAVDLSDSAGISLQGGHEGSLEYGAANRDETLNLLYQKAFAGELDENIKSKNRFPTTFILDANFDLATKLTMLSLAAQRTDCMVMLDCGTEIYTRASVMSYYNTNFANVIDTRIATIEPYAMKVRDPYTNKAVTVTGTYWLASAYFSHINTYGGKHRPLAGNRFGVMSGYITGSVYPVFDEDLHADEMDECAEAKLNIAAYNQNQVVVRKMQNTTQSLLSSLTEQNNVLVLLDIKRDCEGLCATIEYDFSDGNSITQFNMALENITARYADAQVKSITANFDQNTWEAENSIIHLYVAMVCRDLVKTSIIEIDVNRAE